MTRRGAVCYVGLGPGDPRVLAQRAADRLVKADAVLGEELGRELGQESEQRAVDRAIALAREGKRVVRTVPFDAFESPRIIDEMRAVRRAGVDLEVVPGIAARTAAATFAGAIGPATYVLPSEVGAAVASSPPDAVVTLIAHAGSPLQRVVTTSAAEAPARAAEMGAAEMGGGDTDGASRVIVVLGAADADLRWFEQRPLFGKRVLVTRAREQAGSTAALLREHGAEPVVVPTIEIRPPQDPSALVHALGELRANAYAWVAFTSANGVERTWDALVALGADARAFGAVKLAAIGPATAAALERRGLRADIVAKEFRGEGLADEMLSAIRSEGPGRILLARAAKARDVLPDALRAAGCQVDVVAAYETHTPAPAAVEALADALASGRIDAVTFTSSSTVDNFCDLLDPPAPLAGEPAVVRSGASAPARPGQRAAQRLSNVRVASIGPVTSDTARARGIRVDVTAREYTVFGLVQALAESYG